MSPEKVDKPAELKASLDKLRGEPYLTVFDIYRWLVANVNKVSEITTGRPGRMLAGSGKLDIELVPEDGRLYAVVQSQHDYMPEQGESPDLRKFATVIPSMRFDVVSQNTNSLSVEIKVDLKEWMNLAKNLLWDSLRVLQAGSAVEDDASNKHLQRTNYMLEYLYPSLTLSFLQVVSDLGVAQSRKEFIAWLDNHLGSQAIKADLSLPHNLS